MIVTHLHAIHSNGCIEEEKEKENTIKTLHSTSTTPYQHRHRVRSKRSTLTRGRLILLLFWVSTAITFILLIPHPCSLLLAGATLTSNAPLASADLIVDRSNGTLDSTLVHSTSTSTVSPPHHHLHQYSPPSSTSTVHNNNNSTNTAARRNLNYTNLTSTTSTRPSPLTPELVPQAERLTQEGTLEPLAQTDSSIVYNNHNKTHDNNTASLINGHVLSATYNSPKSHSNPSGEVDLYKEKLIKSNTSDEISSGTNASWSFDLEITSNSSENSTSSLFNNKTTRSFTMDWFNLDIDFHSVTSFLASGAIIFGGVVPYIPQYFEILRSKNSSGFSTYVCLNLIAANTLRIIFWFGKHFEIPLLVQSIVMLLTMFIMMEICLRMRNRASSSSSTPSKSKSFFGKELNNLSSSSASSSNANCPASSFDEYSYTKLPSDPCDPSDISSSSNSSTCTSRTPSPTIKLDLNPRHFWQWSDLLSYIECTVIFAVIVGVLMYFLVHCKIFVEAVGYASLLTEAFLAVPQLIKNYNSKSTIGMSQSMVLLWAAGDLFKTSYFIVKHVPMQFIVCGVIQVTVDLMILAQISIYSRRSDESHYRT